MFVEVATYLTSILRFPLVAVAYMMFTGRRFRGPKGLVWKKVVGKTMQLETLID